MRRELFFGVLSVVFSITIAAAQTTTTTTTPAATSTVTTAPAATTPEATITIPTATTTAPTASLATTEPVTATELGVAEKPGLLTLIGLRLQRLFALSDLAKARVTERLARTLLQQARITQAQGDALRAQTLLTQYNQETNRASQLIAAALSQIDSSTNTAAQTLVTQIQEAKILEAALVDEMALKATGEFNKRLLKERAEIAKKLVKLLTKEDLTPAELERKIAKLTAKLAEKEAKAEDKLAKRLATLDLLDEAADEEGQELDEAIGKVEEAEIAALAREPVANLGALVAKIPGSTTKHLVVLQALLDRVPETAKPTIEQVLAREFEKARTKLAAKQLDLSELVDDNSANHKAAKEKLLTRLQEKADERITKAIEKATKKLQKTEERRAKLIQRQAKPQDDEDDDELAEADDDEADDHDEDEATGAASESPTATASPNSTSRPTAPTESKIYKIELEDNGFKTTSLTIAVGDSVTFEVKDEGSYQVLSGPHPVHSDIPELDSGAVGKGAKYSFTFKKAGSFRFHDHLHPSFTGTITVK